MLSYPRLSPARSRLPASQFSGESGAGCAISDRMARHTLCKVHAGLHALLRMSKQISPVWQGQRRSRRVSATGGWLRYSCDTRHPDGLFGAHLPVHVRMEHLSPCTAHRVRGGPDAARKQAPHTWAREGDVHQSASWRALVMNFTCGGVSGYCSGTTTESLNVPPSYGVPDGP